LLSVAGEWAGFDETVLVETISSRVIKKSWLNDFVVEVPYLMFKWMCKTYWKKLEQAYKKAKGVKPLGQSHNAQ